MLQTSPIARWLLGMLLLALPPPPANCQVGIPSDRPGDEPLELPPFEGPEEEAPILPPYPVPSQPDTGGVAGGVRVLIHQVRITGNTAIPTETLQELAASYEGRELDFTDLERLGDALTLAYVKRGYVTSGAVLPDQAVGEGIVEFRIVEGQLDHIEVETDGRFRPSYIRRRLAIAQEPAVNVFALERRLQILQRDPRFRRIQAQLLPAETRGHSILRIRVEEAPSYRFSADFSNTRNPSIGALGGQVRGAFDNALGIGDGLFVRYEGSQGLDQVEARLHVPLSVYDTLLTLRYQGSWADVVDDDFNRLDIDSESETLGLELRQPLYRSASTLAEVFIRGERRRAESRLGLLGIGLPIFGAEDGKSDVTVLRFGFEALYSTRSQVFSGRALLSRGIDALDSTTNSGNVPDSRFLSGLIQLQWARRLPWLGAEVLARFDTQVANDPLLPLEQFAMGGRYTVRGYRENQLVRDNGVIGSIEVRVPVYQRVAPHVQVELVPFFDAGHSWAKGRQEIGQQTLMSVGIGTRAFLTDWVYLEFFWGHDLKDVSQIGDRDLQDEGIHFRVGVDWP